MRIAHPILVTRVYVRHLSLCSPSTASAGPVRVTRYAPANGEIAATTTAYVGPDLISAMQTIVNPGLVSQLPCLSQS